MNLVTAFLNVLMILGSLARLLIQAKELHPATVNSPVTNENTSILMVILWSLCLGIQELVCLVNLLISHSNAVILPLLNGIAQS